MSYWSGSYGGWAPRKTAAQRRADAARQVKDAARRGRAMSPVAITGRKIAHTFWGQAWCDNLERYRDFAYRLERGRSYLRSGSVLDLQIEAGKIIATVSGSRLYDIAIEIDAVKRDAWRAIQRDCAGGIGSRIDLLSGRLSEPVMARLCADGTGLFPAPSAIRFTCSCPDYATMCKHIAAVMYGIGARLDHAPELLFTLRRASVDELIASAVTELPATPSAGRVLAANGLAALFGIELADALAQPTDKRAARGRTKPTSSDATPKPARAGSAATKPASRSAKSPPQVAQRAAHATAAIKRAALPASHATTAARPTTKPALRTTASRAVKPAPRTTATTPRAVKPAPRGIATGPRAARPVSAATAASATRQRARKRG